MKLWNCGLAPMVTVCRLMKSVEHRGPEDH